MSRPQDQCTETPTAYPEDGWLRGYFFDTACDVIGASGSKGVRKNVDFLRLRDVALHRAGPRPGCVMLDVGCADGATMVYCGLQGASVYGQDLNPDYVSRANAALKRFGIAGEAKCGDAARLQFPDNYFDSAISSDFFEHVFDEEKIRILKEMRRVLKPGGKIVIKTPNLSYLRVSLLQKRARAILRLKDSRKVVIPHTPGTDDPQHIGLTTRRGLARTLYEAGFFNYEFFYAPLRRFGHSQLIEILSTEVPIVRDWLCEDIFCEAFKPITLSHFPD